MIKQEKNPVNSENIDKNINEVIRDENIESKNRDKLEYAYGNAVRAFFKMANPFKKFAFKTRCLMHRFINIQAIHILENEGYHEEAEFYRDNIRAMNEGATWIDQDFKSTNHFFHYERHEGLYGFSDALTEAKNYRKKLEMYAKNQNKVKSLFYLGVILHLSQDMTVPQHVSNRLLESHRDYEQFILNKAWDVIDYKVKDGIERYETLDDYFINNANFSVKTYNDLNAVEKKDLVYEEMSKILVAKAQRTTAGLLLDFYDKIYRDLNVK